MFGYDAFPTSQDGCKEFEVKNILGWYTKEDEDKVKDSTVKGVLCVCSGDGCNVGEVSLADVSAVAPVPSS